MDMWYKQHSQNSPKDILPVLKGKLSSFFWGWTAARVWLWGYPQVSFISYEEILLKDGATYMQDLKISKESYDFFFEILYQTIYEISFNSRIPHQFNY